MLLTAAYLFSIAIACIICFQIISLTTEKFSAKKVAETEQQKNLRSITSDTFRN